MRIATWNVRKLYQARKIAGVWRDVKRLRTGVMGVSEVRQRGVGETKSEDGVFVYSGRYEAARWE